MKSSPCFVVLMPIRDDWPSAAQLVVRLESAAASRSLSIRLIFVDDGSTQQAVAEDFTGPFRSIQKIEVIHLRRNLSHQRAIAIGLAFLHQRHPQTAVLIMDADGEDTPEGMLLLLEAYERSDKHRIIFARRARRSESFLFRIFYVAFRKLHRLLTGISVRVGNFSIIPWQILDTLVVLPELWNHYAAAVFRARIPISTIPIARGHRISGQSQMNFTSLVLHGLSAISVFAETVGVRMLFVTSISAAICVAGVLCVIGIRVFTKLAVPGWATFATGALLIILIQLLTIASGFTFFMLSNRSSLGFVPVRDYSLFTGNVTCLYSDE